MPIRRQVAHTFSGSGPFVQHHEPDVYGGTSEAWKQYERLNAAQTGYDQFQEDHGVETGGVLFLQGAYGHTGSPEFAANVKVVEYEWDGRFGQGLACGGEVSFKIGSGGLNAIVEVDFFGAALSGVLGVSLSFRKDLAMSGMWLGAAYSTPPGGSETYTELASGTGYDAIPVDFAQWMTVKVLPTGDWSWGYRGGATIRSGTFTDQIRGGGGRISVLSQYSMGDDPNAADGGPGNTADVSIDDLVLWVIEGLSGEGGVVKREFS